MRICFAVIKPMMIWVFDFNPLLVEMIDF